MNNKQIEKIHTLWDELADFDASRSEEALTRLMGGLCVLAGAWNVYLLMTAKAANSLIQAVVNNEGIVEARTIENRNGVIKLLGDMDNGTVNVAGTLDASAVGGVSTPNAVGEAVDDRSYALRGNAALDAPRSEIPLAPSNTIRGYADTTRRASLEAFPRAALVFIHKSVQDRHFDMDAGMADSDVGRNKTARRQQGWAFPALLSIGMPETPVLRLMRGQAYSGLLRDVYKDERSAWER